MGHARLRGGGFVIPIRPVGRAMKGIASRGRHERYLRCSESGIRIGVRRRDGNLADLVQPQPVGREIESVIAQKVVLNVDAVEGHVGE